MTGCVIERFKIINGLIILAAMLGLLASCSTTVDLKSKEHSIFYPALPGEPRIQFLTSFSGSNRAGIQKNSFADFVLGGKSAADNETPIIKPYGVAMYNNLLYVVDTRLPGYVVVNLEDKIIKSVRGTGSARFLKPINIAIDTDGLKYITDTVRSKILVYDQNDEFVRAIGSKKTMRPSDVMIDNDRLYITDLKNHNVHVVDKRTGGEYFTIGSSGSAENQIYYPTNLAKTIEGQFLISDTGNFSVKRYSRSGRYIETVGSIGNGPGSFARPKGIASDRNGRVYVVDSAFQNVQVFDKNNRVLIYFGGAGLLEGHINLPTDIEIDYEHIALFQKYAKPGFKIEYLIFVTSQYGRAKVNVYGFGKLDLEKYLKESGDDIAL